MTDNPSRITVPGQDNIAALREGLTNAIRLIARHREAGALAAELSQHLLSLQDLLGRLEQELTTQAFERDELAALYGISQVIGSSLDLTEVLNEMMDQIIRIGILKRVDYTAIGSCVNLARRLQEAAAPGQILLLDAVYQQVQKHIEARPLPPVEVQGFSEPITVYELLGLK